MELKRNRPIENKTRMPISFFFFFFTLLLLSSSSSLSFFLCTLLSTTSTVNRPDGRRHLPAEAGHINLDQLDQLEKAKGRRGSSDDVEKQGDIDRRNGKYLRLARRGLDGPGSSPPRCTSKCGKCTPCKAIHVPLPPGTPVTAEYYPEAWRCKCGNKLYMP